MKCEESSLQRITQMMRFNNTVQYVNRINIAVRPDCSITQVPSTCILHTYQNVDWNSMTACRRTGGHDLPTAI